MPEPGLPESFNVLMHELKGLGLDIQIRRINKSGQCSIYLRTLNTVYKQFLRFRPVNRSDFLLIQSFYN
jgi:hypothetical protein